MKKRQLVIELHNPSNPYRDVYLEGMIKQRQNLLENLHDMEVMIRSRIEVVEMQSQKPEPNIREGRVYEKQLVVLDELIAMNNELGRNPTQQELADRLGYKDHSSINRHLRILVLSGYIDKLRQGGYVIKYDRNNNAY